MELTISKVAEFFLVSDDVVEDWIQTRGLPSTHIKDQHRFNREQLLEWATVNGIKVSPELLTRSGDETRTLPKLADAIENGGVFQGVTGEDKRAVLKSAVEMLVLPSDEEKDLLLHVLLAREELGSTGCGGGVAIPHPRSPIVLDIDRPLVSIFFLATPVDFGAIDDLPVHTLFMLVTPSTRAHLHMISRLAFALHDPIFKELLARQAGSDELIPAIRRIESAMKSPAAKSA